MNVKMINTCCFFGHREINESEELKRQLYTIIEDLIINKNVNTFLFGSKSEFDDLCHEIVSILKENHPNIKRIYVRAEYPDINEQYKNFLLKHYKETYFPEKLRNSGKAVYIKRNYEMIDKSEFCVVYYHIEDKPTTRQSGTETALNYANKKSKKIIYL